MFKAYLASAVVVTVIVGTMGAVAYELGRFNAAVTQRMVVSLAVGYPNVPTPAQIKPHRKDIHKLVIAKEQ